MVGNDYDYIWGGGGADRLETIDYNMELAGTLLQESEMDLPRKYFVFSSYSDDQFLFIYLNEGDDPAVYRYEVELFDLGDSYIPGSSGWEYPKGVSKVANSFSEMINNIVQTKLER